MKRKTAKEILSESFRELAGDKAIDKITVQDITDNCGYSPATFYRNFKDKYDLIAWDYARNLVRIMEPVDENIYAWKQTLFDAAVYYQKYKDYLANLFRNTSGHDSFVRYMTDINCEALKRQVMKTSGKSELSLQEEMYIRIYCLGTVSLTCEWLLGKYTALPEEIADIYEKSLPLPLRQFFS